MDIERALYSLLENGLPEKTFLDLAAIFAAPEPTADQIQSALAMDKMGNPHNDGYGKPKRRGSSEIQADLRYLFAHEMLEARKRDLKQLRNLQGSGRR